MSQTSVCEVENMQEEEQYRLLDQVIEDYEGKETNLVQVLHYAQSIFGYLSASTQGVYC